MKIAIMQPYFLPYLGYFQLIDAVDKFIIYDDVSYIKGGWINRNNILVNNAVNMISIPLKNGKSGVSICDVEFGGNRDFWSSKLLKKVAQAYAKAPNFDPIYAIFERWIKNPSDRISDINVRAIKDICEYIGINTEIIDTSRGYGNGNLAASARVLDICKRESADGYVNVSGGRSLYSSEEFLQHDIELRFIESYQSEYKQLEKEFTPGLSILDLLMFMAPEALSAAIKNYSLKS
jgi:hypothetical protein